MEKISPSSKTSSFYPRNVEKPPPQKENVLKTATKRGGNLSQQQNILISPPKCGGNHRAKKNVPENATKPGKGCKISPFKWYICKR